jgi:hypothetical protein
MTSAASEGDQGIWVDEYVTSTGTHVSGHWHSHMHRGGTLADSAAPPPRALLPPRWAAALPNIRTRVSRPRTGPVRGSSALQADYRRGYTRVHRRTHQEDSWSTPDSAGPEGVDDRLRARARPL